MAKKVLTDKCELDVQGQYEDDGLPCDADCYIGGHWESSTAVKPGSYCQYVGAHYNAQDNWFL